MACGFHNIWDPNWEGMMTMTTDRGMHSWPLHTAGLPPAWQPQAPSAGVPANKVEFLSPFMTRLHKTQVSLLPHTLSDEAATSPPEARGGNTDPNSQWEECQRTCDHLKTAVERQCLTSWGSQGRLHRRVGIERGMEICQGKWHGWEVILQREQRLSGLYIYREQRNVRRNVKGDYEVNQASKENKSHCFQTPWLEHINMSEPLMQLDNCPSILKAYTFIWESIAQKMGLKWGLWRDSFFITNTEYLLFTGTILRTWWFQLI